MESITTTFARVCAIWGPSGSGKTHLLKAVREALREQGAFPLGSVPVLSVDGRQAQPTNLVAPGAA